MSRRRTVVGNAVGVQAQLPANAQLHLPGTHGRCLHMADRFKSPLTSLARSSDRRQQLWGTFPQDDCAQTALHGEQQSAARLHEGQHV